MLAPTNSKTLDFHIDPVPRNIENAVKDKINNKTKPLGALGKLEELALKVCLIQQTDEPKLTKPVMAVFAGDHGITEEGVSLYPQKATYQMVYNFINGGAAINVFCRQHGIEVKIIDAGVNHQFIAHPDLIDAKVRKGSKNFLKQPAMNPNESRMAMEMAASIVDDFHNEGSNIIGFGEMGIGNTSAAAMIASLVTGRPLEECVDVGTGLDSQGRRRKLAVLKQAMEKHQVNREDPLEILTVFGGYEIAMIAGGMMKAAEQKMIILVDGFIATSALLIAAGLYPQLLDYCIFAHVSHEKGHAVALDHLKVQPLLNLDMRLGEGTGAALAYPLVEAAVNFVNQMASFDGANVSRQL